MKRFVFKLQKLLEIRVHKEKLVQNELAKAQKEKYLILEKKDKLMKEYEEGIIQMSEVEKSAILYVETLKMYQMFFKRLKAQMNEKDKLIYLADERIKLINDKLIEARKEKRVIERLKDKKVIEYKYEFLKEEQEFFDEVANNKFLENMREKQFKEKMENPIKNNKSTFVH